MCCHWGLDLVLPKAQGSLVYLIVTVNSFPLLIKVGSILHLLITYTFTCALLHSRGPKHLGTLIDQEAIVREAHRLSFKGKKDVKSLTLRIWDSSDASLMWCFDRYLFPWKVMNFTRETDWKMIKWTRCFRVWLPRPHSLNNDVLCCDVLSGQEPPPDTSGRWRWGPLPCRCPRRGVTKDFRNSCDRTKKKSVLGISPSRRIFRFLLYWTATAVLTPDAIKVISNPLPSIEHLLEFSELLSFMLL